MAATLNPPRPALDPYVARFEALERGDAGCYPAWVLPVRKAGIAHFAELGFPTPAHEEWRFTNVAPIAALQPTFPDSPAPVKPLQLAAFAFADLAVYRLVFVDGCYSATLSDPPPSSAGCRLVSLKQAMAETPALLSQHLGRYASCPENAFTALNTALFGDGLFLRVADGVALDRPIHALFLSTGSTPPVTAQVRNLILAGRHSRFIVIEDHASLGAGPVFNNVVTELVVGPEACVEHVKLQRESDDSYHVATIHAHLERQSWFTSHSISLGARIARNDIRLTLNGEGINGIFNGLYLGHGQQVVDHHTVADHTQPHCQSHEYYHGILDGRARGVFNGKIFVRKDAQKTDAKQTNRNLLLSDEATIDTKPQLEIFADDVKCTHGATVGQLDDDAIFYLRSRGIGVERARQILVHAFASDVINRLPLESVRMKLEELLTQRLDRPHGRDA